MSKAILEFDLDDFEDHNEFKTIQNASKYKNTLYELASDLRRKVKYPDESDMNVTWQDVFNWFWAELRESDCPDPLSDDE